MWLALAFISTCGVSADAGDAGEAVLKATIAGCGVGTSIYSTLPCTVPSDTLYAHVVGMYLPELKNASISGEQLEGYAVFFPHPLFFSTLLVGLTVLLAGLTVFPLGDGRQSEASELICALLPLLTLFVSGTRLSEGERETKKQLKSYNLKTLAPLSSSCRLYVPASLS